VALPLQRFAANSLHCGAGNSLQRRREFFRRGQGIFLPAQGIHRSVWEVLDSIQIPRQSSKGKTVDIYTGYTVGGGYDLYTRLLARHIGGYLPGNPTVAPKNMEGAASIRFAISSIASPPRDGTAFGTIGRGTALDPLLGQPGTQFDGTKFHWVGSANGHSAPPGISISHDDSTDTTRSPVFGFFHRPQNSLR
jgi:hypothetical protein